MKILTLMSIFLIVPSICIGQNTPTTTKSMTTTTKKSATNDPIITSWLKSNGSGSGSNNASSYSNMVSNVYYSSSYVWVKANSIPSYSIGPWKANPNSAKGQNAQFALSRNPSQASNPSNVGLGAIGLWIDGVQIYNAWDAQTVNTYWKRNAYFLNQYRLINVTAIPTGVAHGIFISIRSVCTILLIQPNIRRCYVRWLSHLWCVRIH